MISAGSSPALQSPRPPSSRLAPGPGTRAPLDDRGGCARRLGSRAGSTHWRRGVEPRAQHGRGRRDGARRRAPVLAECLQQSDMVPALAGHLTDGLGNRVNFKNTIIIMTSNIGARYIQKKAAMGFQAQDSREIQRSVTEMVLGEVKKTFNPEFINRVDEIIVFEPLSDDDLRRITLLLVDGLNQHLAQRQLSIRLSPGVVDWIIEVTCRDRTYGARPLRRAIQRYIEDPLSEELIRGQLRTGVVEFTLIMARCYGGPQAGPRPAGHWRRPSERTANSSCPRRGRFRARCCVDPDCASVCDCRHGGAGRTCAGSRGADAPTRSRPFSRLRSQPRRRCRRPTSARCSAGSKSGSCRTMSSRPCRPRLHQYYIRTVPSQPVTRGTWVPYNTATEASLAADFDRLFTTPFIDDLRIEVVDSPYPNGVIGKVAIFFIEERRRIKIVDYPGSKEARSRGHRKQAQGIERRGEAGLAPGRRRRAPRGRRGQDPLRRQGLPVRHRDANHEARDRRAEARAPVVQHQPRARRSRFVRWCSTAITKSATANFASR